MKRRQPPVVFQIVIIHQKLERNFRWKSRLNFAFEVLARLAVLLGMILSRYNS